MPFVPVPKDLSRVKTKIALNLTKRQLICFSAAGAIGIPTYLLTRQTLGNDVAVLLIIGLMLPLFFLAMYEKDGQSAEKIARNFIRTRIWPNERPYRTENLYAYLAKEAAIGKKRNKAANHSKTTSAKRRSTTKK